MKKTKYLMTLSIALLTGAVTMSNAFTEKQIVKAESNANYELADTLYDFNFAESGTFSNEWGVQDATVNFVDGKMVAQKQQEIDGTKQMGSYHTKFNVDFSADNAGNFWSMMLRQNSNEEVAANRKVVGEATLDVGTNNGYEIFIQNGNMQLFENNNGNRTAMYEGNGYRFEKDDTKLWSAASIFESEYEMEIWVLNLKDGSVQFVVNVDDANVINTNTSDWTLTFDSPLLNGAFRYGVRNESLVNSTFTSDCLNITECAKSNSAIPETQYQLSDTLTEWNFTDSSAFLSKWGNQDGVLTFDEKAGTMTAYASQEINGTVEMGSYHTKFDLTFDNKSAWWDMMLRQNSGTKEAANGDGRMIDTGTSNGYEIFVQNGHLELFEKVGNNRVAMYAEPNQYGYKFASDEWSFPAAGSKYTFDIWVLNLQDGSVQFIIDVDGTNVVNTNTSEWSSLSFETPLTTGSFRINDGAASGVQVTCKGYNDMGATTLYEGEPVVEYTVDDDIELGNLKFTTVYDDFAVLFDANKSQVSGLNFRQTGEQEMVVKAVEKEIVFPVTISELEGATYAIKDGYKAEYLVGEEYANDIIVVRTHGDETKEYTLKADEITALDTTTTGNKELTITLEGKELKANVVVADYSLKENLKDEFLKDEQYNNQFVVVKTVGDTTEEIVISVDKLDEFDTTSTGKKSVTFVCGKEFTYEFDVADYDVRNFYQDSYKVGEEYANDIIVLRTCGTETREINIELASLQGFDTTTSGVKDITLEVAGKTLQLSIEVYEYVIKQGYKSEYKVGENYAGDIIVLRKVGNIETEVIKISGFDTTTTGEKKLTVTVNGQNMEVTINVTEDTIPDTSDDTSIVPSEDTSVETSENKETNTKKKGCKGAVIPSFLSLLSIAGVLLLSKKR